MNRLEVREQVLCCEGCALAKRTTPVPFSGPTPARVVVLGEAPGEQESIKGEPFVGPAGQLLRDLLRRAGFEPEQMFFANSASCWPGRAPSKDELNACSANLKAQLELANPRWVLMLGGVALSTLRPDLKISKARGHVLLDSGEYPEGRLYFATWHPSWALRQGLAGERALLDDLETFQRMCRAPEVLESGVPGWVPLADNSCVGCGADEEAMSRGLTLRFDEGAASWCEACWSKRGHR